MQANGADVALFYVEVVGRAGQVCPTDEARVDFKLDGPAIWRGGYNSGKLNSVNNQYRTPNAASTVVSILFHASRTGKITLTATRDGLEPATATLCNPPRRN